MLGADIYCVKGIMKLRQTTVYPRAPSHWFQLSAMFPASWCINTKVVTPTVQRFSSTSASDLV